MTIYVRSSIMYCKWDDAVMFIFPCSIHIILDNIEMCVSVIQELMKKVNKQCLLDTPRTVRVIEKTWQVIVQTSRP